MWDSSYLSVVKTTDVMPLLESQNGEKTGNKAKREMLGMGIYVSLTLNPQGCP